MYDVIQLGYFMDQNKNYIIKNTTKKAQGTIGYIYGTNMTRLYAISNKSYEIESGHIE